MDRYKISSGSLEKQSGHLLVQRHVFHQDGANKLLKRQWVQFCSFTLPKYKTCLTTGPGWHSMHFITLGPGRPGRPCKVKTKRKHILSIFLKNKRLKWVRRVTNQLSLLYLTTTLFNINCFDFVSYWMSINARGPGNTRISIFSLKEI